MYTHAADSGCCTSDTNTTCKAIIRQLKDTHNCIRYKQMRGLTIYSRGVRSAPPSPLALLFLLAPQPSSQMAATRRAVLLSLFSVHPSFQALSLAPLLWEISQDPLFTACSLQLRNSSRVTCSSVTISRDSMWAMKPSFWFLIVMLTLSHVKWMS